MMKLRYAFILMIVTPAIAGKNDPLEKLQNIKSDVLSRIAGQNSSLDPGDPRSLDMKVRSLLRDEYTFFRGCAAEFYRSAASVATEWMADETGWVLLHGDIHVGNVGTYQSTGEAGRDIRFGVVDLDETIQGPFQLDLLRALTAVRFAVQVEKQTLSDDKAALALCDGYARTLSGKESTQDIVNQNPAAAALLRKAAKNDVRKYVARYAEMGRSPHFRSTRVKNGQIKDILEPLKGSDREQVIDAVWTYLDGGCDSATRDRFRFQTAQELRTGVLDAARWTRLESSGSQGVQKYLVLLDKPLKGDDSPLILELKEQPVPAPAAIGLLHTAAAPKRAEEVASAYGQMLDPPPRLVGHTRIGDRGFLVRTKDPWGEDLEPADFGMSGGPDGTVQAAALLGEVLGLAHRNGLLRANHSDRIPTILDRAARLPALLQEQSKVIEEQLRREYQALQNDPEAKKSAGRAEEYISRFRAETP